MVKQELSQKAKISIWQGDWVLPKRWGEKFSLLGGAQSTASVPLRRKESAEVARTPVPHTPGPLLRHVPPEEAPRKTQDIHKHLGILLEEQVGVSRVREVWASLLILLPPQPEEDVT